MVVVTATPGESAATVPTAAVLVAAAADAAPSCPPFSPWPSSSPLVLCAVMLTCKIVVARVLPLCLPLAAPAVDAGCRTPAVVRPLVEL